jgi:hypothetical protein
MYYFIRVLFPIILFLHSTSVYSQFYIALEEKPLPLDLNQMVLSHIKDKKSALVFESNLNLQFSSNKEELPTTIKNEKYQILIVTAGANAISVSYEGTPTVLNFGQIMGISRPALKEKEIQFFKVSLQAELEVIDITESEKKRGNQSLPVGPNVSDALITMRVFPSDLQIKIEEENNLITKISKEKGEYQIFLSLGKSKEGIKKHTLKVIIGSGETSSIPIYELKAKEARYYRVKKPIIALEEADLIVETKNDPIENLSDVIGKWSGTLGTELSYIELYNVDNSKKSVSANLYIEGVFYEFTGNYIIGANRKTSISFKKNRNNLFDQIDANLDIEFINGILTGTYLDENKDILDIAMLKSAKIPENQNKNIEENLTAISNILISKWIIKDIDFSEIIIEKIDYSGTIDGVLISKNGNCNFKAKVNGSIGNLVFTINAYKNCPFLDFDLIANIGKTSTITIINNKKGDIKNVELTKINKESTRIIKNLTTSDQELTDSRYIAIKDKVYFYTEPDINTIRKAYILKGQSPEIITSNQYFYYVKFVSKSNVTNGYIKKSDLIKISTSDLFKKSTWEGKWQENNIKIYISEFEKLNNNYKINGFIQLNQKEQSFEGNINSLNYEGFTITVNVINTDNSNIRLSITFKYDGNATGFNDEKLNNYFTLKRI